MKPNQKRLAIIALHFLIGVVISVLIVWIIDKQPNEASVEVTSTEQWTEYANDGHGYKIEHPSNWLIEKKCLTRGDDRESIVLAPTQDLLEACVNNGYPLITIIGSWGVVARISCEGERESNRINNHPKFDNYSCIDTSTESLSYSRREGVAKTDEQFPKGTRMIKYGIYEPTGLAHSLIYIQLPSYPDESEVFERIVESFTPLSR